VSVFARIANRNLREYGIRLKQEGRSTRLSKASIQAFDRCFLQRGVFFNQVFFAVFQHFTSNWRRAAPGPDFGSTGMGPGNALAMVQD